MSARDLRRHCYRSSLQTWLLAATLLSAACSEDSQPAQGKDRKSNQDSARGDEEPEASSDDDDDGDDDDDDDDDAVDASSSSVRDAAKDTPKPDAGRQSSLDAGAADASQRTNDGSTSSENGDGASPSGDSGSPAGTTMDLGKGDGHDVITIGDSWMSLLPGIQGIQESLLAASGQRYRTYAAPGTRVLNEQIPGQYEAAKRENPDIKTVIMTGGGNDILLTGLTQDCADFTDACRQQQEQIAQRLFKLNDEMAADGVKDVITIGYSRGDGQYQKSIDYTIETYWKPDLCPDGMRCHYIDSDEIIHGMLMDGIHPTSEGCDAIAKHLVELMESEGMRR